ncbi:MAG: hypothetical protein RR365_00690 [Bacteroides sp.]
MIDIAKLKYKLLLVTESGKELDITNATEELGWEEGESELALRLSFSIINTKYNGGILSSVAKPGCTCAVIADWGTGKDEVARAKIVEWDPQFSGSGDTLGIMAYDDLYNLQSSQDNRYYSAGTGTKSAITAIFKDWGIPLGEYKGPDSTHAKTLFKAEYLSDIILQLLDDAKKKGGAACVLRCSKGKVNVLPEGSNTTIYHFSADKNVTVARDMMSISSIVTRVQVFGKEDDDGKQVVEAIVDGLTKYGIRQQIYVRDEDDTLDTAKSAAEDIINKDGQPEHTRSISAPDVPVIRKGDKVHIQAGTLNGYYIVKAIRHNADTMTMQMDVKTCETVNVVSSSQTKQKKPVSAKFETGDLVEIISDAENYNPAQCRIPAWVKNDYYHTITQTTYRGKEVIKGGVKCVLLGKKQLKKGGSSIAGINTWTNVAHLRKV